MSEIVTTDAVSAQALEPSKQKLYSALSKAQAEFPVIKKNARADAGKFGYGYVTLDAIVEAVKPAMGKHGLGFYQEIMIKPIGGILTVVFHESGQEIRVFCPFVGNYSTMQQMGSFITYARRYGLQTALGIFAEEDDDGKSASEQPKNQNNKQQYQPTNQTQKRQLSEKQLNRFWAMAKQAGVKKETIDEYLRSQKVESLKDISKPQYDAMCEKFQNKIDEKRSMQEQALSVNESHITTDDVPFT